MKHFTKRTKLIIVAVALILLLTSASYFAFNYYYPVRAIWANSLDYDQFDDEQGERIVLGRLRAKNATTDENGNGIGMKPMNTKKAIEMAKASPYYNGEITVNLNGRICTGSYLVNDNNSYILYDNGKGWVTFTNIYSSFVYRYYGENGEVGKWVEYRFSIPAASYMELQRNTKHPLKRSYVFENFNYESAKVYYTDYDESFVTLNDAEQRISIKAYDCENKRYTDHQAVLMDFVQQKIAFLDKDGNVYFTDEIYQNATANN